MVRREAFGPTAPARSRSIDPSGIAKVLALSVLSCCVVVADASAATGTLTRKPGAAGCVAEAGAGGCAGGRALDEARSVTVSSDGKSAYVTSSPADAVAVFDRAATGELTHKPGTMGCISDTGAGACADGRALDEARSLTVSPGGSSAYVTSFGSGAVAVFDRAASGALTQKPGAAGCISDTGAGGCVDGRALGKVRSVTISPDGKHAYVTSLSAGAVAVFDRAATGELKQKPGTAGCISDDGTGPCIDGRALHGARSVTVSLDGESAYVMAAGGAVVVFDRAASGTLTQKPGTAGTPPSPAVLTGGH